MKSLKSKNYGFAKAKSKKVILANKPDVLRFAKQIRGEAEEVKLGGECVSIQQRTLKIE